MSAENKQEIRDQEPEEKDEAPSAAPLEAVAPPKPAWGSSSESAAKAKKNLLEIMEEEKQTRKEEDEVLQQTAVQDESHQMTEEEVVRMVMQLSMGESEQLAAASSLLPAVEAHSLEENEFAEIERALREADEKESGTPSAAAASLPAAAAADALSSGEYAAIEQALRDADEEESKKSFQVALEMQSQEDSKRRATESVGSFLLRNKGNVRTVTQAEYLNEQLKGAAVSGKQPRDDDDEVYFQEEAGFRINSSKPSAQWCRVDQGSIVGPNNEIRTKHDVELQGQANAHRLNLDLYEESTTTKVGNQAFNSFLRKSD